MVLIVPHTGTAVAKIASCRSALPQARQSLWHDPFSRFDHTAGNGSNLSWVTHVSVQ